MTTIYDESHADPSVLADQRVAVVGYGNQGRCWALNLRDSGLHVQACVRADATRQRAEADGFTTADIDAASDADVICVLVPDDAIPQLGITPGPEALTIVASGYSLAFERFDPDGDVAMVAPRMLGPEVRQTYEEGVGFITAIGVHRDRTGRALARTLALAHALGGLRQGAIEMTPHQEAVLDLAVEQALAPALAKVNQTFVEVMTEQGIPLEGILCELFLSGEVERNYRMLREEGYAAQLEHHSPASQYGQLSRRQAFDGVDVGSVMRRVVAGIADGSFADEWDAEAAGGHQHLRDLKEAAAGPLILEFEADLRKKLGQRRD